MVIQVEIFLIIYIFIFSFFPRIHDKSLASQEWLRNYAQTYLERDVRELINIGDMESFSRFMGLCAGRVENASRGAIFENFVIAELLKRWIHNGQEPYLYFCRDSAGHEIDIIIDSGDCLIPIEVKSGHSIAKDYFKGLNFWKKLPDNTDAPTALIYVGNNHFTLIIALYIHGGIFNYLKLFLVVGYWLIKFKIQNI
jgi:predicted AAA+ superfamily ATPase